MAEPAPWLGYTTTASGTPQVNLSVAHALLADLDAVRLNLALGSPCVVCAQRGPGLGALPDGRPCHRWPCRDKAV